MPSSKRPSKVALLKTLRGVKQRKRRTEIYDVGEYPTKDTDPSDDPWKKDFEFWIRLFLSKGLDTSALKDVHSLFQKHVSHPSQYKNTKKTTRSTL